jgi:glucose-1-phosphate thymidylyltransferase
VTRERGPIGFLPAAGRGVRFGAAGYAKELFPLLFEGAHSLEPRPIAGLALQAIHQAGAERCVVVVSPEKLELVRVLGTSHGTMSLAYAVQQEPRGIPHALRQTRPWLEDEGVVFAMPDTIFLPPGALAQVHQKRLETGADVVLGVFPTDEAERLGPVEIDENGVVIRIHDKSSPAPRANTWGIASWSPRFTAFCCAWDESREASGGERPLGHAFEAARTSGLDVRAELFTTGRFLDIGTPQGLRAALSELVTRGVLVPHQATAAKEPRE